MIRVDMTRGKPSEQQLALSAPMERLGADLNPIVDGVDVRNYGCLEGLASARKLLGHIAGVPMDNMIAWGNSSLTLMYLYSRFLVDEFRSKNPNLTPKWIANTPGYDRHFTISEALGIELISVPMTGDGPDTERIAGILENDQSVIGMWCTPKHSNPCGTTYSDEVVRQCAGLLNRGHERFTIFWDNAYAIHDFGPEASPLLPIMPEAVSHGSEDRVAVFCSTSKITFAGGGIGGVGLSMKNREKFLKHLNVLSICSDKTSQLKHARFFEEPGSLEAHMVRHSEIMKPKFRAVTMTFEDMLSGLPGVSWSTPSGGYFISLNLPTGTASQVYRKAVERGVVLTKAGSAFPYGIDPNDGHLRIAPSYPSLAEIEHASRVIAETVQEVVSKG